MTIKETPNVSTSQQPTATISYIASRARRMLTTMATAVFGLLAVAAPANAAFDIVSFGGSAFDNDGSRVAQAGAHANLTTSFSMTTKMVGSDIRPDENLKDVTIDLPPGITINPQVAAECSATDLFGTDVYNQPSCSSESQVGTATVSQALGGPTPYTNADNQIVGVYNLKPNDGAPALLGFKVTGVVTILRPRLRADGNYSLTADVKGISQGVPVTGSSVTLWGVPADPVHDARRAFPGAFAAGARSSLSPRPLVTLPTACPGSSLQTSMTAASWQQPDRVVRASFDRDVDGFPMQVEGCDKLAFVPSVSVTPSTTAPDAPSGLDVDISNPQNLENPNGLANAQLRNVKVTLPEGMTINPGSADGLQACSDAQLNLGNDEPLSCPDGSKIGTVTASTPLLADELSGGVYLRSQASDDPESGAMFRIAVVLDSPKRGILVKLAGRIRVNKDTGRIVTEFDDNPQIPVEQISLHLKTGPRAPLASPTTCGTKTVETDLTSWAGHHVTKSNTFDVPCVAGLGAFAPVFTGGVADSSAGAFTPFNLNITKPDGNAALTGLSMTLPTGLLARLRGNLNTQVGTVKAYAGPGSNPFMLPGKVYLEGAYGDAPFSLRVVVSAKAGPFDLGEVTVRQKIYVDPITAQVTVVSDPLPTVVKGVPVRLQRLDVAVDKPGFVVNPTSCAAKTISGTMSAIDGQTAPINVRFEAGNCASLALKPELALSLSGKGQTTDGKHPAISATLTQPAGQANLKKVAVTLPLSLALDTDNANGLCEFVDGTKVTPTCPKASIVGTATATTPILDEPLTGPVYFVKNIRKDPKSGREIRTTPKLVIPLTGQNGVKLTLTGTSDVEDDQLVTTFNSIPDAPVSSFKLNIIGGKGGILVVSGADICKNTQIADQQVDGQNNKQADTNISIQTPDCPLKIISKKVTAKAVTLKVGGLGAGKVTVTGKGIRKTTKTITKSTVATIVAKRSKGKPGKVTVSFDPAGPAKARKTTK